MRTAAVVLILACASTAEAQQTRPSSGIALFAAASIGLARFNPPPQNAQCPPASNRGDFCGRASGATPLIAGGAGIFFSQYVGLGFEGSLSRRRVGSATYGQPSHTDYDITTAVFEHSAERSVSAILRARLLMGKRGAGIEPVAGVMISRATDRLTDQVRVSSPAGFPRLTTNRPDAATAYSAKGFIVGVDVMSRSARNVSFVGSARLRWLNWPLTNSTYHTGSPQIVPVSIGRWSLMLSAGVRFTSRP